MLTNYALPAGVRVAGAVAVVLLAASPVWSQTSGSQDAGAQATEQQVVAPVDPIIAEVRRRLAEPARRDVHRGDRAALTAFYAARTGEPVWVTGSGLNARAQDAIAEIRKAEDWGLVARRLRAAASRSQATPRPPLWPMRRSWSAWPCWNTRAMPAADASTPPR